jgi:ubiquinone/menaquinone biosynthesis C-methylase UbiE
MTSFLNPAEILEQLDLNKDMIAVDFGSGSGGWAIPLARKLEDGFVYAIDILEEPISSLRGKIKRGKFSNISAIRSDIERKSGFTLADSSTDLVLMANVLFQTDSKKPVFIEANRILKQGGRILAVDWKKTVVLGPEKKRVSDVQVKKIAESSGFKLGKELDTGLCHWGLILVK